jgi:hypothetical protein
LFTIVFEKNRIGGVNSMDQEKFRELEDLSQEISKALSSDDLSEELMTEVDKMMSDYRSFREELGKSLTEDDLIDIEVVNSFVTNDQFRQEHSSRLLSGDIDSWRRLLDMKNLTLLDSNAKLHEELYVLKQQTIVIDKLGPNPSDPEVREALGMSR